VKSYPPIRAHVKVDMHLDGGYTRVILFQVGDGGTGWDIPTAQIPVHLRRIGSEFILILRGFIPEATDSLDTLREMCRSVQIEEIMR
jgi:cytochrome oxidase assembly protein ShyY1